MSALLGEANRRRRVIFLRHGQTAFNLEKRVQGCTDIPLTLKGIEQARTAAGLLTQYLSSLDVSPASVLVISSPLGRAKSTAQILAAELEGAGLLRAVKGYGDFLEWPGIECAAVAPNFYTDAEVAEDSAILLHPDLRERGFGQFEGLTIAQIEKEHPAGLKDWLAGATPAGVGVEPRKSVGDRVAEVLRSATEIFSPETLVFVSHGGAINAGVQSALNLDITAWSGIIGLDNCHWAVLEWRDNNHPVWKLKAWNMG